MRSVLGICLLSLALPVLASNPGEPLDCSDWVFLEPGLSCSPLVSFPCDPGNNPNCDSGGATRVIDNTGRVLRLELLPNVVPTTSCGMVDRLQLVAFDGQSDTVLGYIDNQCVSAIGFVDYIVTAGQEKRIMNDLTNGRIVIPLTDSSTNNFFYESGNWVAAITGFTTTFEILQTFTPTADVISFRTPYMPEGFQFADFFDTYTGDLATVGDWSQLQPLACGYPVTAPSVGDYLTVADTLADPAPGTGRYYLTVANFMGQRRFGRKNIAGVLSGRDPAVLPACP